MSWPAHAHSAAVRIDTQGTGDGTVRQMMLFLDNARPLTGRSAVWAEAPRLLVTAVITGQVRLATDLLRPQPLDDPFLTLAASRFSAFLAGQPLTPPEPETEPGLPPHHVAPLVGRPPLSSAALAGYTWPPIQGDSVLPQNAAVSFGAQRVIYQAAGPQRAEPALLLVGDVRVLLEQRQAATSADSTGDPAAVAGRSMSLQAGNVVIFLAGDLDDQGQRPEDAQTAIEAGPAAGRLLRTAQVRGIYLEDNVVATDGQFTVRAPRVYYDVANDRAVLLDAVIFTYDIKRQVPLYLRAGEVRQEARRRWEARDARLTTSDFAQPHVAIGASRLTLEQEPQPDSAAADRDGREPATTFDARDTTLRIGGAPLFYWPALRGRGSDMPLTGLSVEHDNRDGVQARSTWDVFALADHQAPDGVQLEGQLDYLGRRGPGLGAELTYERPTMLGAFKGYGLLHDEGEDEVGDRMDVSPDDSLRGLAHWQHRQYVLAGWELSLETAYVSDPMFLESFEPEEAYTAKPYETSLYLKKQQDDWALTFLGSTQLNDFTPQLTTLQAPGYNVEKLPELGYYQIGTDLLGQRLTYFGQTRASRMRILGGDDAPIDRGFTTAQSARLFGIAANTTSFDANLAAMGVRDDTVLRLDTRHEVQAPMTWGQFDVVPYVVGRATAYDDDFAAYDNDAENLRLWGSAGVRLHTSFARTYPDVNVAALDVHQLRHIIEPELDLFYAGATVDPEAYPVYDADVESIAEGPGVRVGLRNSLQTKRGGVGRWRDVDWLVLQTDLVLRGRDAQTDLDAPTYYAYRPEFGRGGDHVHGNLMWMVTDALAMVGDLTYGLEDEQTEQWRIGARLDHSRQLSSFASFSRIADLESKLLTYGFEYRISSKYAVSLRHTLDLDGSQTSRSLDVTLERRLPQFLLLVSAGFDEVDDIQSLTVQLRPLGFGGRPMLDPGPLAFE